MADGPKDLRLELGSRRHCRANKYRVMSPGSEASTRVSRLIRVARLVCAPACGAFWRELWRFQDRRDSIWPNWLEVAPCCLAALRSPTRSSLTRLP